MGIAEVPGNEAKTAKTPGPVRTEAAPSSVPTFHLCYRDPGFSFPSFCSSSSLVRFPPSRSRPREARPSSHVNVMRSCERWIRWGQQTGVAGQGSRFVYRSASPVNHPAALLTVPRGRQIRPPRLDPGAHVTNLPLRALFTVSQAESSSCDDNRTVK